MIKEDFKTKKEIYICNFDRENGESCFKKGAKDLTDHLKSWAKENYPKEIKVVRGGCLGKCSEGIAMACYPERKFLLHVALEDEEEIKKILTT